MGSVGALLTQSYLRLSTGRSHSTFLSMERYTRPRGAADLVSLWGRVSWGQVGFAHYPGYLQISVVDHSICYVPSVLRGTRSCLA